jgi:hypothetical protein
MHPTAVTTAKRLSLRNHLTHAKHPDQQATQRTRTGKSALAYLGNPARLTAA